MAQLVVRLVSFIVSHKFTLEIAGLGLSGIILPELVAVDHAVKILVGIVMIFIMISKERSRIKKEK